uniref:Immunoglobulin domain-containing protein n=1 Tax=Anas platyrhynchos TaxID=8839 RepID=A0A8B9STY7_ANAPL
MQQEPHRSPGQGAAENPLWKYPAGGKMVVEPREPLVRYGDAVQLNCSLPCTGAMVQWKGLDTNLGSIDFFPTHSVLHINSAEVATEGTKICQGTCGEEHYQKSVNLKVYCKTWWRECCSGAS